MYVRIDVRFYFHCRSFSPCGPLAFLIFSPPLWIFMFFFLQNSSLLFPVTRSSSFSVNHVSVNIKNNVEKDTTLLLFFLFKSPGGHAISFQIKPCAAFRLPYLLIELFYIGMSVVRTDSWAVDWSVYGHVITKFSWMGSSPSLNFIRLLRVVFSSQQRLNRPAVNAVQWRHSLPENRVVILIGWLSKHSHNYEKF